MYYKMSQENKKLSYYCKPGNEEILDWKLLWYPKFYKHIISFACLITIYFTAVYHWGYHWGCISIYRPLSCPCIPNNLSIHRFVPILKMDQDRNTIVQLVNTFYSITYIYIYVKYSKHRE